MAEVASRYTEYLRETPEERTWLEEWGNADLSTSFEAEAPVKRGMKSSVRRPPHLPAAEDVHV